MKNNINDDDDVEKGIGFRYPFLLVSFVIIVWFTTIFLLKDDPTRGTFGDMFGATNALFSGLAFVGLIIAIVLQGKELKLQRIELKTTRHELEGQKLQLEAQNKTLRKQNFENTFFELLKLQNEITNSIDLVDESNKITKGRDCFHVFFNRFSKTWKRSIESKLELDNKRRINETYLAFFNDNGSEFGHYFRILYNIIKFVDGSEIPNKKFYTNLIRAQLSSFELALLFYNCLSEKGDEKFYPLVVKYSLLKSIPFNVLLEKDHAKLYDNEAFSKS